MSNMLKSSWPLLLGMALLMVGNGVQGTLLGIRGAIEGFSTFQMSIVMSAYFIGFLGGSQLTPGLIRRVGHVRVFAALGSFISAVLVLYPTITDPWAWAVLRVLVGFCFCGVYVTAESWLNNAVTNEYRGQALSAYMIVQMVGIVAAQGLMLVGDPSGFVLFVIPSVLVSLSFAPILLTASPSPAFSTTKAMSLRTLFSVSPLGCIGMFLMGGVFSAQFGMASVYAGEIGLSVRQIAVFMIAIYLGGMLFQFPIGWLSDRMDRRKLILAVALIGGAAGIVALLSAGLFAVLLVAAFVMGGMTNPLYSLLIAYTNDYLEPDNMAAASGGLLFINGLGAIMGPLVIGVLMETVGPQGFWLFASGLLLVLAGYAAYRMTQRAGVPLGEAAAHIRVLPTATAVAVEAAAEWASDKSADASPRAERPDAA